MINLLKESKLTRVNNAAAAGTTTITTDVIDMAGFDGCTFLAALGDVTDTSALELVAQHGDASDGSDMADVETATVSHTADATDADNMLLAVEVMRPQKRYVRAKLVRGTANAVVDGIFAVQTNPAEAPTTHDSSTVLGTAFALSPADA